MTELRNAGADMYDIHELDDAGRMPYQAMLISKHWIKRAVKAEAEVKRLREALGFYANNSNYNETFFTLSNTFKDHGEKARVALRGGKGESK